MLHNIDIHTPIHPHKSLLCVCVYMEESGVSHPNRSQMFWTARPSSAVENKQQNQDQAQNALFKQYTSEVGLLKVTVILINKPQIYKGTLQRSFIQKNVYIQRPVKQTNIEAKNSHLTHKSKVTAPPLDQP